MYKIYYAILTLVFLILIGFAIFGGKAGTGGVLTSSIPRFSSASSTAYTAGASFSQEVLQNRPTRFYASFCNHGPNSAYLGFGSTQLTATTSADVEIASGACYEIDQDNRYTGEVELLGETATTTNGVLVTELIGVN